MPGVVSRKGPGAWRRQDQEDGRIRSGPRSTSAAPVPARYARGYAIARARLIRHEVSQPALPREASVALSGQPAADWWPVASMARHSKWAKVKHFKGAIDAKRSRLFARLSRELTVGARSGGGDAELNPRLRMVLLKCRAANMPSENIDRAIKRGVGGEDITVYEEL